MAPEKNFLPTAKDINHPVDIQHKDGDPRKTAFAIHTMMVHKRAFAIYKKFGLLEKQPVQDENLEKDAAWGHSLRHSSKNWERRKHFATEHMVTVIAGVHALGQLFEEKGLLTPADTFDVGEAAAIHDAGKELEFVLVKEVLDKPMSQKSLDSLLEKLNVDKAYLNQIGSDKLELYLRLLQEGIPAGIRGLAAYDLAGDLNELRLEKEGAFSNKIIGIQRMVGHSSSPDIEALLEKFDELSNEEKSLALQTLIMHYVDDVTTNPNVIDPKISIDEKGNRLNALDRRCIQNEDNPKYKDYNLAWQHDPRNKTGETAFAMQRRVGHRVEQFLAEKLGIEDSLSLPEVINKRVKKDISQNWKQNGLTLKFWNRPTKLQ